MLGPVVDIVYASSMAALRASALHEFSDRRVTIAGPFQQAASVPEGADYPDQLSLAMI